MAYITIDMIKELNYELRNKGFDNFETYEEARLFLFTKSLKLI